MGFYLGSKWVLLGFWLYLVFYLGFYLAVFYLCSSCVLKVLSSFRLHRTSDVFTRLASSPQWSQDATAGIRPVGKPQILNKGGASARKV